MNLNLKETDFTALLEEGVNLFCKKSYVHALKRFWSAFRIQPGNPDVLYNIGKVMEATKDPRAEDFYAAAAGQGSVDAHYALAIIHLSVEDIEATVVSLKAFLAGYNEDDEYSQWAHKTLTELAPHPRLVWSRPA